jgi:hypothetical protein
MADQSNIQAQSIQKKAPAITREYLLGQKLMMDWLSLMRQFTPYDSGFAKEWWDTWHARLRKQTQRYLEQPDDFLGQVVSLHLLVDEWLGEQQV